MARKGRESKLTPERETSILRDLRAGNTRACAAERAGIGERTLARWIAHGKAGKKQFVAFVASVKKAEQDAENVAIRGIRKAAKGGTLVERRTITKRDGTEEVIEKFSGPQWQAYAWWAERKNPDKWGQQRDVMREMKRVLAKMERERAELRRKIHNQDGAKSVPAGSK